MEQRGGHDARAHLIRMVEGKPVCAVPVDLDCYGRTVARVWRGPHDLSARMVHDGYAVALSNRHSDYASHERSARFHGRGLWADDPVNGIRSPAAFRRWQRGLGSGQTRKPDVPDLRESTIRLMALPGGPPSRLSRRFRRLLRGSRQS